MKHTIHLFPIILTALFLGFSLSGCQKEAGDFPFTSLTWESGYEDMIALEGSDHDTYDSVYEGTTYTYAKEYLGRSGTIKYMFDSEDALMCVAWAYGTDSTEELDEVYQTIHQQLVKAYGDSGYHPAHDTNYGDVWYLESGDILISAVTTESQKALQYAYLNPAVSNQEE